jgi:tetratricopeptide (TPR) repeat protein
MALCLYLAEPKTEMSDHFTQALRSRSFFVRMAANYYLSLIQNENGQFLEARSRAYQALGLLKAVEQFMPETMDANCYFIAAESLTSHVLNMHNQNPVLDGQNWSRSIPFVDFSVEDQQQLTEMLMARVEETGQASLTPRVEYYPNRPVGSQWTGISLDTPLEQLFWRVASEADLAVSWDTQARQCSRNPTTLYLPFVDRQYLLEVIAAGAGLIWRYDGQMGVIHDPANNEDFQASKQVMCQEAISVWQRFLIRYRTDFRIANAHYCLGKLYEINKDPSTALGHYKMVYSQFNQDELAPYALFNAGKVKSLLHDYTGAKDDLNELLIHYPNFKVIGEAILHMADVTMKCKLHEEAAGMYERAFHLDISPVIRRSALFGRGRCAFECEDYEGCIQWLSQALTMTPDISDIRRGPACLMLGHSFARVGRHEQAAKVLRMTLDETLAYEDYVQTVLELVDVECERENFLQALTILGEIPSSRLSQEDACRFLLVKSNIYRLLDLTDTSISLLRRQIEFIADARLRAQLTMELAYCYMLKGDLDVAQRELNDAMYDLPPGYDTQRGGYLLARMAYLEGDFDKSERLCFQTLQTDVQNDVLRNQVYELLGDVYTKQNNFNNAALAYAGVIDKGLLQ